MTNTLYFLDLLLLKLIDEVGTCLESYFFLIGVIGYVMLLVTEVYNNLMLNKTRI